MPKPDPALLLTCASCGRQQPASQMGRYPDGRDYCLRAEGKGGECWKMRPKAAPVITRPIEAVPASSGAFVESAR